VNAAFVLLAAAMAGIALACLLWPLLRRGDNTRARTVLAIALSFALPVAALALYLAIGTPAALDPANRVARQPTQADLADAVAQLEAHLKQKPDDADGWVLLGHAYQTLQRPADAVAALDKALALAPDNADVLAADAEAHSLASADHRIDDASLALLQKAVAIDPKHQRALWLLGIADYQRGDFPAAVQIWNRLLPLLDPGSGVAHAVREQIDRANAQAQAGTGPATAMQASAPSPTASAATTAAAATDGITVHVTLDPALESKAKPADTVFVYARAVGGPPMPLAVARLTVADLPATVRLTDAMAMTPQLKLSMFPRVQVSARISASGNAMPQPGDLEAAPMQTTVTNKQSVVSLDIDRMRH
jgi:cytochrome c-type biogenesis protein CcmH